MKQKGYCPSCKSKDPIDHVIEVDSNEKYFICPNCGGKILTSTAVKEYKFYVRSLLRNAGRYLSIRNNYLKSYVAYARVIEFDHENPYALSGRLVSLAMMSTVREGRFDEVRELLIVDFNRIYRKSLNESEYINISRRLLLLSNQYLKLLYKRLTFKNVFYDSDCIKLFTKRIDESIKLEKTILSQYEYLLDRHPENLFLKEEKERVSAVIQNNEKMSKSKFTEQHGYTFKAMKDEKTGIITCVSDGVTRETNVKSKKSLSQESGIHKIKDKIFTRGAFISVAYTVSSFSLVLALAALILSFIFPTFKLISWIFAIVFLLGSIAMIVIAIVYRKKVSKELAHLSQITSE